MSNFVERTRFLASGQDDAHSQELDACANEIERLRRRDVLMTEALKTLASGRKPCKSGLQRVSRDEMKSVAREYCLRLGIRWTE